MKKNTTHFLFSILFLGYLILHAQSTITVYTNAELSAAFTAADPSINFKTTIILANGTWTDVQLNFAKTGTKAGTAANPITIKAQTPGSVFIEGKSYIRMGGEYIFVEGIIFQNPSNLDMGRPIIEFKGSSTDCNNCKVTNIKIDNYNGSEA